jgi:hypothetical protein
MAEHKGKPSGKFAEKKTSPGRKGDYKRSGWPEDAPTQRAANVTARQQSRRRPHESSGSGLGRGRNRKAGSPI